MAITLTLQQWDLAYVAATVGSDIDYGLAELFVIEKSTAVDEMGIAILEQPAIGSVSVRLPDESRVEVSATVDNTIDVSRYFVNSEGVVEVPEGTCIYVTYRYLGDAKSVTISSDQMPRIGRLAMEGIISDNRVGEVGKVIVDIPSFSLDGTLSITLNADGSTSESAIAGTALAVDGTTCGQGSVYGYVRQLIENESPRLTDIVVSPSPIELEMEPTPTSQQLSIVGSRGVMFSEVLVDPSDCTYESDSSLVASVSNTGLVQAVGGGEAIITITHTASGLTDTVDVEVSGDPFDGTILPGIDLGGGVTAIPGLDIGGATAPMGLDVTPTIATASLGLEVDGEVMSLGIDLETPKKKGGK